MGSLRKHRVGAKRMLCTLALVFLTALIPTGCSFGRMLPDSELADVLSEDLGKDVEIIEAPEGKSDGVYKMKCSDGTEFTVERTWLTGMFGGGYYHYSCDYLVQWVYDHPETNAVIDERGLSHENFDRGTEICARSFDELHIAVETACALVEDSSNRIPAVSDLDEEYVLKFMRPVVKVTCLDGEDLPDFITEFEFSDGTDAVNYDEELEIYVAEQKYVDDFRSGWVKYELPDELLEKYGPSYLDTELMKTNYSLIRARSRGEDLPVEKSEMLYYVSDNSNPQRSDTLDFQLIAAWADCTGFEPYAADGESYTLARGEEKVVLHFSDSGCYAERNGVREEIRGMMERSSNSCNIFLTTGDLTKLFDTEFRFDFINGTAEITNKRT